MTTQPARTRPQLIQEIQQQLASIKTNNHLSMYAPDSPEKLAVTQHMNKLYKELDALEKWDPARPKSRSRLLFGKGHLTAKPLPVADEPSANLIQPRPTLTPAQRKRMLGRRSK